MKRLFASFVFALSSIVAVAATPTDLGQNLAYVRVHSLSDDAALFQAALVAKNACVLDLRYATSTEESIASLRAALAAHPAGISLFILVSPATPTSVADIIKTLPAQIITLGIAGSQPTPRITVKSDTEADRLAYDAFEKGTPLSELVSGKIDKERYDEATLVKEFKNGNTDVEPPLAPDPTKSKGEADPAKPTDAASSPVAPPLKDRVLQRALNLHQALLALRR